MGIEFKENRFYKGKKFEETSVFKKTLDSIDLDDPEFPTKLRKAEEGDDSYHTQDKKYSFYTSWCLNKFWSIKKEEHLNLDSLIPRFFLRKTIFFGHRTLSEREKTNTPSKSVKVNWLVDDITTAYIEFGKIKEANKYNSSKRNERCFKRALEYLDHSCVNEKDKNIERRCLRKKAEANLEFSKLLGRNRKVEIEKRLNQAYNDSNTLIDELGDNSVESIGRRVEICLDLGQLKEDDEEKAKYFEQAYKDSLTQIEKDISGEAEYKLEKICNFYSNLHVADERKKEKIEKGIEVIGKKREEISNFKINSVLGHLYIKRAKFKDNPNSHEDFRRGSDLIKDSIKKMNPNRFRQRFYIDEAAMNIMGFDGEFLLEAYQNKTEYEKANLNNLEESDLETLIYAILCSELSEEIGNKVSQNYNIIATQYYCLQYLIEKASKNGDGKITIKKMKEKINEVLEQKNEFGNRELFQYYAGGLRRIVGLNEETHKLETEMQFLAIEYMSKILEKSSGCEDITLSNISNRAMCLIDMVRLNKQLNKFNIETSREMLRSAHSFLETVLKEKLKLREEDTWKDRSKLASCKFYLANVTNEKRERERLYKGAIKENRRALKRIENLDKSKICGFMASSFFKLAEISTGKKRKQNLEEAIWYYDKAYMEGEKAPENKSNSGRCWYELLKIKLKKETKRNHLQKLWEYFSYFFKSRAEDEIDVLIKNTKKTLEEAKEINKENTNYLVYPYFQLYFLAKDVVQNPTVCKELKDYDLEAPEKYVKDAIDIYSKNNRRWFAKQVSESKNVVIESKDNYGLLEDIFLLKKGGKESLEKEKNTTELLKEKLREEFGEDRRYFVPKPHCIVEHTDDDANLSGWYYAMSRKEGVVLEKILEDKKGTAEEKSKILENVVDFLAFIHTKKETTNKHEDYSKKMVGKLNELKDLIGWGENVINLIKNNYSPILKSFEGARIVFNKDAHPENWLVTSDKKIGAIDFDDKEPVPIEFDLVNLMEYGNYFSDEEKKKGIKDYINSFKKYNDTDSFEISKLRYLNAVIHRAISLVTALSSPERKNMWPKRKVILNNALHSVDRIKEEYQGHYLEHANEYKNLQKGLIEISQKITD